MTDSLEHLDFVIGLRIKVPYTLPSFLPAGNHIGAFLLGQLLLTALQSRGVKANVAAAGPLNEAELLLVVNGNDKATAFQVMAETLAEAALGPLSSIGYFCFNEGIWRCYPKGGTAFQPIDFARHTEASKQAVANAKEEIRKMQGGAE